MASTRLVVFELNGAEYAVDAVDVNGILRLKKFKVQKIPGMPKVIEGMINLRGKVNYIFNLKAKFDLEDSGMSPECKIVMLNVHNSVAGCIVDEVTDIVKVEEENFNTPPEFIASFNSKYIKGIVKAGERLIIVLNTNELLSTEEYKAVSGE